MRWRTSRHRHCRSLEPAGAWAWESLCGGAWKVSKSDLRGFGFLGAVLRAPLLAVLDALGVEAAAHDVVAHARQVFHPAAPYQHHRVLLQVVAFPADVADDLESVGEAHFCDLAQRRIRLLWRGRVDARAHAALLWPARNLGYLALCGQARPRIAHQLIDCRHYLRSKKDRDGPSAKNGRPAQFEEAGF